jgi:hypothetical protein
MDPQAKGYFEKAALLIKNIENEMPDTADNLSVPFYCARLEQILQSIKIGNKFAPVPDEISKLLLNHINSYQIIDRKDSFLKIMDVYKRHTSGISEIALVYVFHLIYEKYLADDQKCFDANQLSEKNCEEILKRKLTDKNIEYPVFSGNIKDLEQALTNFSHIPFHSEMAFFLDASSLSEENSFQEIIPLIVRKNGCTHRYEVLCTSALGHSSKVELLIDKLVNFVSKMKFGINFYSCSMERTSKKTNSSIFAIHDIYSYVNTKSNDFDLFSFAIENCVEAQHIPAKLSTYIFNYLPPKMMKSCQSTQIPKSLERNSELSQMINDKTNENFQKNLEKYSFYTYQDGLPTKVNFRAEIKKMRYVTEIIEKAMQ